MKTRKFICLGLFGVFFLLNVFLHGGCASSYEPSRSGGWNYFFAQNDIIVLNNTDVLIDVYLNGRIEAKDVKTGEIVGIPKASLSDGERVVIIAIGHTALGEYVGASERDFYATSGYSGRQHQSIFWPVRDLRPPGRTRR